MTRVLRRNLCLNPSFEVDTSQWAAGWNGGTLTRDTSKAAHGSASCKVVANAGTSGVMHSFLPVAAGDVVSASCEVAVDTALTGTWNLVLRFLDASNALLSTTTGTAFKGVTGFALITAQGAAPAGTAHVQIGLFGTSVTAADTFWFDRVIFGVNDSAAATFAGFFTGNTADTADYIYTWDGAAGVSTSTASPAVPTPAATGYTDADPCPRVEVVVSPMPSDAASITVWRNYAGTTEAVRGASGATVAGDFVITDFETPLGTQVTYTCQTVDTSGVPSATSAPSAPATLNVPDVWVSDPLDPSTSMAWPTTMRSATGTPSDPFMRFGSFTGQKYTADQALITVLGSSLPIGVSSVRRAPDQMPLVLVTRSQGTAATLLQLLSRAPLCLRVPPSVPLIAPVSYVQMPDVSPDVRPDLTTIEWTLAASTVRGPALTVFLAVRSLDDLGAEAATLDGLGSVYVTMLGLERGIAGT